MQSKEEMRMGWMCKVFGVCYIGRNFVQEKV